MDGSILTSTREEAKMDYIEKLIKNELDAGFIPRLNLDKLIEKTEYSFVELYAIIQTLERKYGIEIEIR